MQMVRLRQVRQIAKRGVDVNVLDQSPADAPAFDAGGDNHEWRARGDFKICVLAPEAVFAELPTVVAPQNDDRVVGDFKPIKFIEQAADLRVDEADAGVITANQISCGLLGDGAFLRDVSILPHLAPVVAERLVQVRAGRTCCRAISLLMRDTSPNTFSGRQTADAVARIRTPEKTASRFSQADSNLSTSSRTTWHRDIRCPVHPRFHTPGLRRSEPFAGRFSGLAHHALVRWGRQGSSLQALGSSFR